MENGKKSFPDIFDRNVFHMEKIMQEVNLMRNAECGMRNFSLLLQHSER